MSVDGGPTGPGMVERVARAICKRSLPCIASDASPSDVIPGLAGPKHRWEYHADQARAAIEAMREPTNSMYEAGSQADQMSEEDRMNTDAGQVYGGIWEAMIDAALQENSQ